MRKPAPLVRWAALAAIVFARVASRASAQEVLAQAFGSAQFEEFGFSIAGGGPDLDGDGFAEIAVHARITQSGSSVFTGSATLLSGRDLTPIHTIYGANSYDQLGFSLAWCDDLDGDALADLVV